MFIETALEALFPSNIYCISCGSLIDRTRRYALCDQCIEHFHWLGKKTCGKCGKILAETYRHALCYDCRQYSHIFDRGYTCVTYGFYERDLMMDYKYRGKAYIGKKLGDILYDRISLEGLTVDYIVPVPMYKKKEQKRGYNQAALMAKRLGRRMETPYVKGMLVRQRDTKPMRGLNPAQRFENLQDAFAISPNNSYNIEGKRILLIDDIYTTGSTADACADALRKGGVGQVFVLSFAAGGNRRPEVK